MTTRYLSVAELKTYVRTELTLEDDVVTAAINAAEVWLDSMCARRFIVATTSTARVYKPSKGEIQIIDDCTTIASVVDNGVTLTSGIEYQAEPLNALSEAGEAVPYYALRRLGYQYNKWLNWFGVPNAATLTVTAAWGWPSIPPMIKEACKIVAKDYLLQREVAHGLVGITDVGGVGSRENKFVADTVSRYLHPNAVVIG